MRTLRLFLILMMFFLAACGPARPAPAVETQLPGALTNAPTLVSGAGTAVATQLPGALTNIPTLAAGAGTAIAPFIPQTGSVCPAAPANQGLGLQLGPVEEALKKSGFFAFQAGTNNGQPETVATFTSSAAATFDGIAAGFSAHFIGDPCNLTEVKLTIPRTNDEGIVEQSLGALSLLLPAFIPGQQALDLIAWLYQYYGNIPVGGSQQASFGRYKVSLKRDQANMNIDIVQASQ